MADPTNDAARAQALLSQAGATTCVGPKAPSQRRGLRLKSLWTGLALGGLVAGVMHFMGGHPAPTHPDVHVAPATHAAAEIAHGAAPVHTLATATAGTQAPSATAPAVKTPAMPAATPAVKTPTSIAPAQPGVVASAPSVQAPAAVPTAPVVPVKAAPAASSVAGGTPLASNLITLPIPVTANDDELSLSKKLSDAGEFFPALALSLEKLRLTPYYDGVNNSNENIAIGYNITKRIGAHGRQYVHDELLAAGIATRDVDALLSTKHKIQKTAHITPESALRLLYVVAPEYEGIARDAVGPTFDKLPKNRQAAVTWLAYNTGDVSSFTQLVHGVQHDNLRQAMEHMTPWFRDTDGQVMVKNERAGAYLQGAYYSEAGLKKVVQDPAAFEDRTLVHKESPIAAVDPAAAKALKKKGQLPIAPTAGPNTKPLPGASAVMPPAPSATINPSAARWTPPALTARKLDDWQARQAPVPAPTADQDEINRSVSGPRGP